MQLWESGRLVDVANFETLKLCNFENVILLYGRAAAEHFQNLPNCVG
jgi:hypothetical protein